MLNTNTTILSKNNDTNTINNNVNNHNTKTTLPQTNKHYYTEYNYELKIMTLNVRGLAEPIKRKGLNIYLKDEEIDIAAIQETFMDEKNEKTLEFSYGQGKIYQSLGSNHSSGIAFLFAKNLDITVHNTYKDTEGKLLILKATIANKPFLLVNIYSPNNITEQKKFYDTVYSKIDDLYTDDTIIICGDYNCIMSNKDKKGGLIDNKKNVRQKINKIITEFNLIDTWRYKNKNETAFTWAQPDQKIMCRLDHILISAEPQMQIIESEIKNYSISDHLPVITKIRSKNYTKRGRGIWKNNVSLLQKDDYIEVIRNAITKAKSDYRNFNPHSKLELIKFEIQKAARKFSKNDTKNSNAAIELLLLDLE